MPNAIPNATQVYTYSRFLLIFFKKNLCYPLLFIILELLPLLLLFTLLSLFYFIFLSVRDWPNNELEGVLVEDFGYFTYLEKL